MSSSTTIRYDQPSGRASGSKNSGEYSTAIRSMVLEPIREASSPLSNPEYYDDEGEVFNSDPKQPAGNAGMPCQDKNCVCCNGWKSLMNKNDADENNIEIFMKMLIEKIEVLCKDLQEIRNDLKGHDENLINENATKSTSTNRTNKSRKMATAFQEPIIKAKSKGSKKASSEELQVRSQQKSAGRKEDQHQSSSNPKKKNELRISTRPVVDKMNKKPDAKTMKSQRPSDRKGQQSSGRGAGPQNKGEVSGSASSQAMRKKPDNIQSPSQTQRKPSPSPKNKTALPRSPSRQNSPSRQLSPARQKSPSPQRSSVRRSPSPKRLMNQKDDVIQLNKDHAQPPHNVRLCRRHLEHHQLV